VNVSSNDFLRVRGEVYQIGLVIDQETVHLTANFTGGFTDILKAYYLKCPGVSSSVLSYDASAASVDAYLESQLTDLYPLYGSSNFEVARQTLSMGYSWLVTFTGEMFAGDVDDLILISSPASTLITNIALTSLTTLGSTTSMGITTVENIAQAGDLPAGEAVYVRIAAINSIGMSPFINFLPTSKGLSSGNIVPRSPPGLPLDVEVFAVADSTGTALKVTWAEGETYGSAIASYQIEVRETNTSTFITRQTLLAADFGGNSTYMKYITVDPINSYEVRVRALNDLGEGGPSWFQKVGSHDLNAIMTLNDFRVGAQRATPTCEIGLVECEEANSTSILPRGLPGVSILLVPAYPTVDSAQTFTETSGLVMFSVPVVNGDLVDKYRVEWSLDSVFTANVTSSDVTANEYYNITSLTTGVTIYIRVVAHNSLGYGAKSLSYPFKPRQQPGVVVSPALNLAFAALDLVTYARSLNVSWIYPMIMASEGALVGDGGVPVTSYLVEWSKQAFSTVTPTVQNITIVCGNLTNPSARFSLNLTTVNAMDQHHDGEHYHSGEYSVVGTYSSGLISVNASAYDVKKAIENMPNVATVEVERVVGTGFITWIVTFSELAAVPLFSIAQTTIYCASAIKYPSVTLHQSSANTSTYSWIKVATDSGTAALETQSYLIKNLLPGQQYYVQISAANDLGFGTRKLTGPTMLTVPFTPPTAPTQAEGEWSGPKVFLASPTSLLVRMGPPTFDGGSLAGTFVVEWDTSGSFDSGLSGQALGMATVPSYVVLCTACVSAIEYGYNTVDPTVVVTYAGDYSRQLQAGVRVAIVTTDDYLPYTFTVGDTQSNATQFVLRDIGLRETTFGPTTDLADLYLLGADYEIAGLSTGSQYHVRVKAENSAGACDPSMKFIADCGAHIATTPATTIVRGTSDVPEGVIATVTSSTGVQVNWTEPFSIGDSIVSYRVDAFTRSALASTVAASPSFFGDKEVQEISTYSAANTTGTFTIAFGSYDRQLPGTVTGLNAEYTFNTTEDLTPYLEPGDIIFVDEHYYTVALYEYPLPNQVVVDEKITASVANGDVSGKTVMVLPKTNPVGSHASAVAVQAAINAQMSFGQVHVERVVNGLGYTWMVTFESNVGDQPTMVMNPFKLLGDNPVVYVVTSTAGVAPNNYQSVVVLANSTTPTSTVFGSLTTGETWYFRVCALNDIGNRLL
jgi:hypothetical protein